MHWSNITNKFILLGFTASWTKKLSLFPLFLLAYMLTLLGNIVMLLFIIGDNHLHKPMYFFIGQLSFLDVCYSSVISPKMLVNFLEEDTTISFLGCEAQMYFFVALGSTECFLLASMAYDRYVAVCNPLCSLASFSLVVIVASYILIIISILHIRSEKRRMQLYSTCISHFTSVGLYFGTILFMYLKPKEKSDSSLDKVISVFYTVVIPLLNPVIYSIRNKEVKEAFRTRRALRIIITDQNHKY
ncbi:olfactory receptor 5T1-like [Hyperolius riggenbachi]|uniref:olfactory receptor 5T1-like n=1 Tax=Hyperolius riggenbachi TaxID=752182 RepID=UPI0035A2DE33